MKAIGKGGYQLTPEGKLVLLMMACEIPLVIVFASLGQPKIGLGVCVCSAALIFPMWRTWSLHRNAWYWLVAAISVLIQVPLVFYIPWTNRAFRGAILFVATLDCLAIWGCYKLAEKLTRRDRGSDAPN
jgi:hypothetical protein